MFVTETPISCARNVLKRAVSSIPAMPTTRSLGNPETLCACCTMASRGLDTTTRIAFGECCTTCSVTLPTIRMFVSNRSSRLIPGRRAMPAVITTTSDSAVAS